MSFGRSVAGWAKRVAVESEEMRRAVILELFSSVILDTPVDTGRLRGNWQISSGSPASGEVEIVDPEGTKTVQKVQNFPLDFKSIFLTNNLPYAYRIEFEGWSTKKAPGGMVRRNFVRVSENLKNGVV